MQKLVLDDVKWNLKKINNDVPGLLNSFIAGLTHSLRHAGRDADFIWLMGVSGFAFRIIINAQMCLSGPTSFLWKDLLPESIEQAGYSGLHIYDGWDDNILSEKRGEARNEIEKALKQNILPVVWEIELAEWGLITGFDDASAEYTGVSIFDNTIKIAYDVFGRNKDIGGLSVSIPGRPNSRSRREIINNSLKMASAHAKQKEWCERPSSQDGLPAYDLWASIVERGEGLDIVWYSAGQYYSARCCAYRYLRQAADGNELLLEAAAAYNEVAELLGAIWEEFLPGKKTNRDKCPQMSEIIRKAGKIEAKAIDLIDAYLESL